MAGAGKKTFAVNEVLSAADVNNYLMDQSVMRFADSTARSSAIGTPSEGMVSYLDDSNQVEVYDGSSWVNFTGDITQVTAGTALTGGGTEGNVTLNVDESAIEIQKSQVSDFAHASTHESGGSDELSLDGSQVSNATPTSAGVVEGLTSISNQAFGPAALRDNVTGAGNVAIGRASMLANDSGSDNTALGRSALLNNTTGNQNIALGHEAGDALTAGDNNTVIGFRAAASSTTVDNEITLGNVNITSLRCNVQSISSLSDERDKKNIQESALGLDLIQRLRPVTFDWDRRDGSFAGRKDVGFIAQDVVEVEDELDIEDTLRMSYRSNPEKLEVAQARLIPVLTKAIQELSEQNAELKARLDKLEGK